MPYGVHYHFKMIIIFHLFSNILTIWKNYYKTSNLIKCINLVNARSGPHPLAERDEENNVKFDPPMYKQRYERVTDTLMHEVWKNQIQKVVDFGCSEFGLFVFLKNIINTREILCVDVDELLLRDYLFRLYPLNADYFCPRQKPLTVKVFVGSIAEPDPYLLNTDAVIGVEIIEHLYPDVLEAVPYNLFSYIAPKIVIITTPNVEFNVLFEKMNKFRHPDHKFEWTREQFESWANNITLRFPRYVVKFDGIGLGPSGCENIGCCSQLALFVRKDICDTSVEEIPFCICDNPTCNSILQGDCFCFCNCRNCLPKSSYGVCTYNSYSYPTLTNGSISVKEQQGDNYKLIANIEYPYHTDTRTEEEKALDELKYRMSLFTNLYDRYDSTGSNVIEIPLKKLVYKNTKVFLSEEEVRLLLLKFHYKIEECLNEETNEYELCVILETDMDRGGSDTDIEASGYESDKYESEDGHLIDGDENTSAWNEIPSEDVEKVNPIKKEHLHLEVDSSKKQESLFDSGYQKSPSVVDSPRSPAKDEVVALDFKVTSNEKPKSNILSVFVNLDKVNELDALRKERKYFNASSTVPHSEMMKKICQEIAKHPIAGPSRDSRKKQPKKINSPDSDNSVEDLKSITTCIIENSLNRIDCDDECHCGDLIQDLIPEEVQPVVHPIPAEALIEPIERVELVENGDLANNNRDFEGNNYPAEVLENPELQNDNVIDNLEHNNVHVDNNNEFVEDIREPPLVEVVREENVEDEQNIDEEIAYSSREALYDANSQVDLLDDFDMDASVVEDHVVVIPNNYIVVASADNHNCTNPVLPPEENGFPNWLLNIFDEGEDIPEEDLHDEPHFYCQGDGLGVHPSIVAVNNDADDEGTESGSDSTSSSASNSSSSSGSAHFISAENHSIQDLLPVANTSRENGLLLVGQQLVMLDPSNGIENVQEDEAQSQEFENQEVRL